MLKILFVGNFHDATGWSHYGINQVLALDSVGFDVVCRNIKLNNIDGTVPEKIKELEKKKFRCNPDILILNVLPHYMEYSGKFKKNIGLYMVETSNFISSTWANHINLLDQAWVPSYHNVTASKNSGVTIPVQKVPTAVDVAKYDNPPPPLSLRDNFKDDFIFYTISEITSRKNLHTILKAFHTEFDRDEPVQLLIKTTPVGLKNPQQDIQKYLNDIKMGLKLYPSLEDYKSELVIFQHLSQRDVEAIHSTGDCFISASHGEAICLPAVDAMGYGKPIIVPHHTGFLEYINEDNSLSVYCESDRVFGCMDSFQDIYTGRENWYNINVDNLAYQMRVMYENRQLRERLGEQAKRTIQQQFSYERVGAKLKELLYVA